MFARGIGQQRHPGQPQAAVVRGVLAQGELAVHVQIIHGYESVVLIHHAIGTLLESLGIVGGPPVLQIALRVELAALIVEAVRQLVAHDGADVAVVGRIGGRSCHRRRAAGCRQGS